MAISDKDQIVESKRHLVESESDMDVPMFCSQDEEAASELGGFCFDDDPEEADMLESHNKKFAVTKTTEKGYYDLSNLLANDDTAELARRHADSKMLLHSFVEYHKQLRGNPKILQKRYENRLCIDDYLQPLLSGDLIRQYNRCRFSGREHVLPESFNRGGHEQYYRAWHQLFLYETYSFLLNARRATFSRDAEYEKE